MKEQEMINKVFLIVKKLLRIKTISYTIWFEENEVFYVHNNDIDCVETLNDSSLDIELIYEEVTNKYKSVNLI